MSQTFKLPKNISFSIPRGDRKDMNIRANTDLTGKTVWFTAKVDIYPLDATDSTAVIQKSTSSHIDAVNGITVIEFMHNDTKNVVPGLYYCDIQIVDDGQPITTQIFRMEVTPEATQRVS